MNAANAPTHPRDLVIALTRTKLRREPPRIIWVTPEGLHLTLRFLGEQPDERVPAIIAAIREPVPIADLREIAHGHCDGLTRAEAEQRFPKEIAAWEEDPFTFAPGL